MTFDKVDKYRVNRYQKSTIVSLNDLSSIIYHLPIKTFDLKQTLSGFPQSIFALQDSTGIIMLIKNCDVW